MKNQKSESRLWHVESVLLLALCLCIAAASPASAGVVYDFSLPANAAIGAIDIQLTFPDFLPTVADPTYYHLDPLINPEVTSLISETAINASMSEMGIAATGSETWVGLLIFDPSGSFLALNLMVPASGGSGDFFVFARTPTTTEIFSSTAGLLSDSSFSPVTTPTGTLTVSETVSSVPEPATASLLGLALLTIAGWRLRRLSV